VSDLNFEYSLLIPEFILAGTAIVVLFVDLFRKELGVSRSVVPGIAALGAIAAGVAALFYIDDVKSFADVIAIDNFTTFFRVLFTLVLLTVIVSGYEYVDKHISNSGEFYALLLLSTIGAIYMSAARELLTAYISIELLSFSLYVAVTLAKNDPRSAEAGLKYVLLGGVASAMLLYGMSLIYGTAGSTSYDAIAVAFAGGTADFSLALLLGLTLLIAGLAFKASAVPFHMWTPDVYEGAPLPITAYLSATSKAATFALLLRLFAGPLLPVIDDWQWIMAALATMTMIGGNLIALQQSNIKRLLAYSSIGQVGYMLMAITTISDASASALLVHMAGYLVTNLTVFAAVIAFHNRTGKEELDDFRGLAETNPYLAMVLTAGMFSLAGMPLLAGFVTKFILFQAAASGGFLWLTTVAMIASTISLYYYLQLIRRMYLLDPAEGEGARWRLSPASYVATGVLGLAMILVGVYAGPLFTIADRAAAVLSLT
jgi:NADH-quinone oxidoreductase subunit N